MTRNLVISLATALLAACTGGERTDDPGTGSNAERTPSRSSPEGAGARQSPSERAFIEVSKLEGQIVFSAGPSQDKEELYVIDADGSGLRRVTHNSHWDFDPSWSPEGDKIAFRSQRGGNDEIHVVNADGTGERNISRSPGADWGPAWSPRGATIAFNSDRDSPGELLGYVVHAERGRPRKLGDYFFEYPAWSPDGRRLVFMHQTFNQPGGNYEIAVANADGSGMTLLTDHPADDGWPQWSPDGNRILFTSLRDDCDYSDDKDCEEIDDIGEFHSLYVMNADGTQQTRISGDEYAQFAAWSPDGRYIMFTPAPHGFYVMQPDGSGLTSIPIERVGGSITLFDWTQ